MEDLLKLKRVAGNTKGESNEWYWLSRANSIELLVKVIHDGDHAHSDPEKNIYCVDEEAWCIHP